MNAQTLPVPHIPILSETLQNYYSTMDIYDEANSHYLQLCERV